MGEYCNYGDEQSSNTLGPRLCFIMWVHHEHVSSLWAVWTLAQELSDSSNLQMLNGHYVKKPRYAWKTWQTYWIKLLLTHFALCWESDAVFDCKSSLRSNRVFPHSHTVCEWIYMLVSVCSRTACVYLERIQTGPALVCVCCLTPNECVARLISRAAGLLGCTGGGGQSLRLSRAQPRHVSAHISLFW